MTENITQRRINWKILIDMIIRSILVLPLVSVALFLVLTQRERVLFFTKHLPQQFGFITTQEIESFLQLGGYLLINLVWIICMILASFIVTVRLTHQLRKRINRAFWLTLVLILIGFLFLLIASFLLYLIDPQTNAYEFLANIISGLSTEVMGAWLLFILLDVFAKTWEENEDADLEAEAQAKEKVSQYPLPIEASDLLTELKESETTAQSAPDLLQEKLNALLAEWEQAERHYQKQAKAQTPDRFLKHTPPRSAIPAAYYEGQAKALADAKNSLQKLLNTLEA